MNVTISNDDPFGNNFRVVDVNAGGSVVFQDHIEAHGERAITCQANDAGYGNITTFQDNNPGIGRSFLHEGERISL